MRRLVFIILSIACVVTAKSQTADLKKINHSGTVVEDQKEINRLKTILTQRFLATANSSKDTIYEVIQEFFSERNFSGYDFVYPKRLEIANLTINVIDYDYNWGLLPSSSDDTSELEGYRNKTLIAIVTIPVLASAQ